MARFNEEKINKQILRLKAIRKKYALEDKGIIGDYCRASTDKHIDNFFMIPKLCIYLDKCEDKKEDWDFLNE